jgi:hypothetical protein
LAIDSFETDSPYFNKFGRSLPKVKLLKPSSTS